MSAPKPSAHGWGGQPEGYYNLTVRDESGQTIAGAGEVLGWAFTIVPISPGEELVQDYDLNKIYLLTDAGDYTISAKRHIFRMDGEGFAGVKSDPVVSTLSDDASADAPSRVGEWGPVMEGFQLMVEVSPAVVPSRAPVLFTVVTRSVSSRAAILRDSGSNTDCGIRIEGARGTRVPTQRFRVPNARPEHPPSAGNLGTGRRLRRDGGDQLVEPPDSLRQRRVALQKPGDPRRVAFLLVKVGQ